MSQLLQYAAEHLEWLSFCRRGATVLHAAVVKNSVTMARLLLQRGADTYATAECVARVFISLISAVSQIYYFVDHQYCYTRSSDAFVQGRFDCFAFCCASEPQRNHAAAVAELGRRSRKGQKVCACADCALHLSEQPHTTAQSCSVDHYFCNLTCGQVIVTCWRSGKTPLDFASEKGHADVVELLRHHALLAELQRQKNEL